jgi:vacuolar-type H+-ATPase subunit I/STV1
LRKSQLLAQELMKLRDEDESLRKKFSVLETFRPAYNLLCGKFPNEDVRSIIAKFDRLAEYVVEYTRSIGNLENEIALLRRENDKLRETIGSKETIIRNEEIQRSKIINNFRHEVDSRDLILNDNANFKDMYFKLFNRILTMYLDWTSVITVFDGKNKMDIKPDLSDPFNLIDVMSKIIRVSTDDSAQKYITKIIVSANQLVRRYFPFAINEKFDPDKIYERTHKYIDKLQREIKRLNPKSEELKPDQ